VARRVAATVRRLTGVPSVSDERVRRLLSVEGQYTLGQAVSPVTNRHALVGWTSHAHTAVDVGLYAYGPGANRFVGNHDNTYVGRTLADLLGVNLGRLTRQIRADATSE
jgi:alkaline phosphatase